MPNPTSNPVVFLAFANSATNPLPHLAAEYHRLASALKQAEDRGHCTLVTAPYATLDDIVGTFQRYRGRIAIFHYAGHADQYALLLQNAVGQPMVAHAGGLAAFLGHQTGLQLVFFNGCCTQPQVQNLLDAGAAVIIATSQAINDEVATDFSAHFYQFLVDGDPIDVAFAKAQATLQTAYGSEVRHLHALSNQDSPGTDRWPWNCYVRPGADMALRWNLPDAANDPLFGLPPIPAHYYTHLPDLPFRGLTWFATEHAALFYGRGYQIRELYQQLMTPHTAPLLLYYGQSGVGKSSLLAAGLTPRLESSHTIYYLRRDQSQGLLGTLQNKLLNTPATLTLGDAWAAVEAHTQRPLLIILDQVEEVFTRPNLAQPHELADFLGALQTLYADSAQWPHGKLVLGFRKEWLAELKRQIEQLKLPYRELFLARLDKRGILAAIAGPTQTPELQAQYHLQVAPELPTLLADDMLADPGSAVAPTLQILLTKLWAAAKRAAYAAPTFTPELYAELRKQGLGLSDILEQQMVELGQRQPTVVASGLAWDLLAYHTTPFGTAEAHTQAELSQLYAHCQAHLPALVAECSNLYLLVDSVKHDPEQAPTSRLAHDTLAPLVRARFNESNAPGQRARRILENRVLDWRAGRSGDPLDDADLALVESGEAGMRAWTADEVRLVQASRAESAQRRAAAERVQQSLEQARQKELAQAQELARHTAARLRQKNRTIRVLATIIGCITLWVGMYLYQALYFGLSAWQPIAGDNFPNQSNAYAIVYVPNQSAQQPALYCVATWLVGVGCSQNGQTWNFYQQGLPTGTREPVAIGTGGFSGNMRGITALTFAADNPMLMYAFSLDHYFYHSPNRGQAWIPSTDSLPVDLDVTTLAAQQQLVLAVAHKSQTNGNGNAGLYLSTDSGQTWPLAVGPNDPRMGSVYDAAFTNPAGTIVAATAQGIWLGEHHGITWTWQSSEFTQTSRLLTKLPGPTPDWAVVTYQPTQRQSTLWLGALQALNPVATWPGEPLRLALDPRFAHLGAPAQPLAYVLLVDGDIVKIDTLRQTRLIKGLNHPLFGAFLGQSHALAVVPAPDQTSVWLLLGHRKGLLRYTLPP